jgi:hypothetical protein
MTPQDTRRIANLLFPQAQLEAAGEMRSMRAYLIKARGDTLPHQQAGYKAAILSLSVNEKYLASRDGSI